MTRVETAKLVQLLDDLSHTAAKGSGGAAEGIMLHSTRGYGGENVGMTDMLVGTSTNGVAVGHANIDAYGQLAQPMLWPLADARAVIASFKPRLQSNKEHALEITTEDGQIVVREDPDLFGDGLALRFDGGQLGKFPHAWRALDAPPSAAHDDEPGQPRSDYYGSAIEPFVKVAKSRGEPIQLYRYHHRARILVQIGDRYRGALTPGSRWVDDGSDGDEPSTDIHTPDLPDPDDKED